MSKSVLEMLKDLALFSDIDEQSLPRIAQIANKKAFAGGEVIVNEGELAESFYLIVEGKVAITKKAIDG